MDVTARCRTAMMIATSALVLAACGGDGDDAGAAEPDSASGGEAPVTLTVTDNATRGGQNSIVAEWMLDDVIPAFEAQMSEDGRDITIDYIEGSSDDFKTALALDLSVESGPDVFNVDQFWIAEFAAAGYLTPLTDIAGGDVAEWEGWDDMSEAVTAGFSLDDEIYGLPFGTDGRVLYYRVDLFEEAGLDADWQPTSWDDILDTARQLADNLDGVTPVQLNAGVSYEEATAMQGTLPVLLGVGVEVWDEDGWITDSPDVVDAFAFYEQLYDEGLADLDLQLAAQGRDQSFERFSDGEIAILLEGDFFWRAVISPDGTFPLDDREDRVGYAQVPASQPGAGIRGQDTVSASGGTGRTINPRTEHPAEAWEFLRFVGSTEMLEAFVAREPRITASETINAVAIADDPLLTFVAEEVLPNTWYRPGFEEYPEVSALLVELTEDVVTDRLSPEEASAALAERMAGIVGADQLR